MDQILEKAILDFTVLEFHQQYVISRLYENVIFEQSHLDELSERCLNFYKGKRFVYISVRRTSYNVNPMIYLSLSKAKYLSGIAIVSENPTSLNMALFEQKFSPIPFDIFLELEEAVKWAKERIEN